MEYEHLLRPRTSIVAQDAGILRRAVGFIIDILVLDLVVTIPFTPLLTNFTSRVRETGVFNMTYTSTEIAIVTTIFLVAYAYFIVFEYVLGQTLGQMALSIHVTHNGFWQVLLRNAFLLPFFPFVFFWVIEPFAIIITKRGILERLSQTRTLHQHQITL
jgi:hypothetical protein